jgi:hypothetical protein
MEPAAEIRYKRLTPSRMGVKLSSLWLAPDHLLSVNSSGFAERYKRFYFRDIQAVIIKKTQRRAIYNAILATFLACLLGLLITLSPISKNEAAVITWLVVLGIVLFFFLVNNLLGAGCVTYLRTAVQIERLPALGRIHKVRRVLQTIRPLIAMAQGGELSSEAISARMQEFAASLSGASPASAASVASNEPTPSQS